MKTSVMTMISLNFSLFEYVQEDMGEDNLVWLKWQLVRICDKNDAGFIFITPYFVAIF